MQEKESDAVNNQRKRRKRIGKIRNGIIITIAGWIILSMILIICLFVQVVKIQHKLDNIVTVSTGESIQQENANGLNLSEENALTDTEEQSDYEVAIPLASGIDDVANQALENDIHKVYLTFEDGPSENTAAILDILKEYDVKATFFVIGKEDEESLALYQRIAEEGHTLGMHSFSNKYSLIYQSEEAFEEDFTQLRDLIYDTTGIDSIFYRFPGGSSNQISNVPMNDFIHYLNEQGIIYYDWNVSAGDATANAYSAEEIVANVTSDVVKYKTSVILLHDASDKSTTVEALRPLIEALKEMDAEILPIDEDTSVIQYVKADSIE